jgi:hypothetical protein
MDMDAGGDAADLDAISAMAEVQREETWM